jgi:hypothetical protein
MTIGGGAKLSDRFVYGGAGYTGLADTTLSLWYSNLQDYYQQAFIGAQKNTGDSDFPYLDSGLNSGDARQGPGSGADTPALTNEQLNKSSMRANKPGWPSTNTTSVSWASPASTSSLPMPMAIKSKWPKAATANGNAIWR